MQLFEQGVDLEKFLKSMPFHLKGCQIPKKTFICGGPH